MPLTQISHMLKVVCYGCKMDNVEDLLNLEKIIHGVVVKKAFDKGFVLGAPSGSVHFYTLNIFSSGCGAPLAPVQDRRCFQMGKYYPSEC